MGKLSSWLIAISIFLALAVGYRVTCASEHLNTGLYDELQGRWHISAVHLDSEEVDFSSNATDVDVVECYVPRNYKDIIPTYTSRDAM